MSTALPAPGWYRDPGDATKERYWNGWAWTRYTAAPRSAANFAVAPSGGSNFAVAPSGGSNFGVPPVQPLPHGHAPANTNGLAIAALICGLVGLALGLIPILFFMAWALGITGFVLGLYGRARAKVDPLAGREALAIWGIVLSIASFGMGCVGYALMNHVFTEASKAADCIDAETAEEFAEAC